MQHRITALIIAFIAVVLSTLVGCKPIDNNTASEDDVVYTAYDVNFNFAGRHTFFMPDSVLLTGEEPEELDLHVFDDHILSSLAYHMTNLGWERLPTDSAGTADLVLLPMIGANEFSSCYASCWDCGWGYWNGWDYYPQDWGAGWGWYYPPSLYCNSFATGTLYVILTDPNNANATTQDIPVVWKGLINGVLGGSPEGLLSRIDEGINEMFVQSPELKK